MAVERLTDYTRRIWTALGPDAPEGHDIHVNDVIYYMDSSECCIVTNVYPDGSIDCETLPDIGGGGGGGEEVSGTCWDLIFTTVTIGPNNVGNVSELTPYLVSLAGWSDLELQRFTFTVIDHTGAYVDKFAAGMNITTLGSANQRFYRYNNGAFENANYSASYNTAVVEGDTYLLTAFINKGAPSV